MSVKWRDREVRGPLARVLITAWCVLWAFITIMLIISMIPIWLPLDWLLRRLGRRGFIIEDRGLVIELAPNGFRRV